MKRKYKKGKAPQCVCVLDVNGHPLMPTFNWRKVRKLLKSGNAHIAGHHPFTIRLTYETTNGTQPVEYACDTGCENIGISVKSEKHEYFSVEAQALKDEKKKHDRQRRTRRARRNRKRYRKPRFDNRKRAKEWFAPSLLHKKDVHVSLYERFLKVIPITDATFEMGQFDTQLIKAIENGDPIPEGIDYQHGDRYGFDTLREAVFYRDGYTCQCCGASPFKKDKKGKTKKVILRVHHIGFKDNDRSNRMSNLLTVCTKCHTAKNHKPGGKLYELEPEVKPLSGATFMNTVKWQMLEEFKAADPMVRVNIVYGAKTKRERLNRNLPKSHINDAYCIGSFRPKHKANPVLWIKKRRNDRCLQKFYDAKYIDRRTGEEKKAAALGCNRTNRKEPRISPKNERIFRGRKVSKGYNTIRRKRTTLKPGSIICFKGELLTVKGTHTKDGKTNVEFTHPAKNGQKSTYKSNVTIVREAFNTGWEYMTGMMV